MFCKKCGTEMNDTARFCHKCGTKRIEKQEQRKKIEEENRIIGQLKPKFNILYHFLSALLSGGLILFYFFVITRYFIRI